VDLPTPEPAKDAHTLALPARREQIEGAHAQIQARAQVAAAMSLGRRRLQPVRLGSLREGLAAIQRSPEGIEHAPQPGLARANAVLIGGDDRARADTNAVEPVERQ
jgi:hypothetical protein